MQSFITENLEEIIREWESFAGSVAPAASHMDPAALRDHVRQMLQAIALDVQTPQSDREQVLKSKGLAAPLGSADTAAETHGAVRFSSGFDLNALVAEFRALRATVLRLWIGKEGFGDADNAYEIARFNEAIDQALAESVAAYSAELQDSRDTFVGVLGHDLRSPLAAIGRTLDVLASSVDAPSRSVALAEGRRAASSMDGMIRDLLEYTRSRLGKGIPVNPGNANLENVCKAAIGEVSLVYPQTTFRFESSGSLEGRFDAPRMHQVAANLLNNAVQHGKRGAAVTLITQGDATRLVMQVKSAGTIDAPILPGLFDPRARATGANPDASRLPNSGLGLFIAREIVTAHGGTIGVTSTPAEGTIFTAELPRVATIPVDKAKQRTVARRASATRPA